MAGSRWQDRHWDGHLAHQRVRRAVARGAMVPQPCEECGGEVSVGHHDDYARPLEVRWLCDRHHRRWHLAHPVDYEVLRPPTRAKPVAQRVPNRGKQFHRYLKPKATFLRGKGFSYADIAQELGVSVSTAHAWAKGDEP